jgi:hypothetical protein
MTLATLQRHVAAIPQRWLVAGLLLAFLGLSVQYGLKANAHRSAIIRWTPQLQELDDQDIYERHGYPNPPMMAILLQPLVKLPTLAQALCWFYLKACMALLALHWVFRLVEHHGQPFPLWAKALATLLSLRPIFADLTHGNVNVFIWFLVAAALYAFQRGRDWTAGLVLALAVCCKVTPVLFVPYFLWKRAWRTLAGCAVGLTLFLWVVPGAILGQERNARDLGSWLKMMVIPYVRDGVVTSEHHNQSLPGLVHRMTTDSPAFSTYAGLERVALEYRNLVSLSPASAGWLIKGCMVLFAGLVVCVCRTATRGGKFPTCQNDRGQVGNSPPHGWRLAAEFSIVLLGMLLFSERTWKQHCVTLMLPFAVVLYYLGTSQIGSKMRAYLIGSLVLAVVLMGTTSTTLLERAAKEAQVYGAYVWAYLLLAVALGVMLRGRGSQARSASEGLQSLACASGSCTAQRED